MAAGAGLGVLGLLLLMASTANTQESLQFSELDYSVTENNPAGRVLQITKTGTNIGDISVTLQYLSLQQFLVMGLSTDDFDIQGLDTAEVSVGLDDDFIPLSTPLIIPPSISVDVLEFQAPIVGDNTHELDEGFFVTANFAFSNADDDSNFSPNIVQNTALIRILNDDTVTIEFELLLYELQENSGDTEIVIQKANGAETEVELVVMVDFDILSLGIMEGSDFTLNEDLPQTFTFQPTDEAQSLIVSIVDDTVLEIEESFALTLFKDTSIPDVDIEPGRGLTVIRIIDNEEFVVGFTETEVRVFEGDGVAEVGLAVFAPDVSLVSPEFINGGFVRFNLVTLDGTANATDYESITTAVTAIFDIANSMFTIDPQPLVTVTIVNDDVPEDDEDFTLVLTPFFANGISLGVVSANPNVSRVIIRNDDASPSVIGFVQGEYNVTEGNGTVTICVAILSPSDLSLLADGYQANLTLSFEDVSAQDGLDYTGFTVDFSLTAADSEQCFDVDIALDGVLELEEYFRARLAAMGSLPQEASLGLTEARVNIFDGDVAIVGFEMENVTVTEGVDDFAVIRISFLSPPIITSESFTELTIFTQDGNAIDGSDYTENMMTVTLRGGGEESLEIMIPILDDFIVEENETLTITFVVVSDSGNIDIYSPDLATITIVDNDVIREVVVGFEQSVYMTSENDDFVVICAAILDSITLMPLEQSDLDMLDPTFDASFNFSLTQDTALEGADYINIFSSGSLTPTNPRECFNVDINDDDIFEQIEYFDSSLDFNEPLPEGATLGITSARVSIEDNDVGVIGLRNVSYMVNESVGSIRVYVEFLSPGEISEDIEVNVTITTINGTAFGGSDFTSFEESLTLQGGTREVVAIDLFILEDDDVERPESEELEIRLTSSSPLIAELRLSIVPDLAVVTIIDDDVYTDSVAGFEQPRYDVDEGDGFVEICAAILKPANASTLHDTYVASFNLSLADGSAFVVDDYGDLFASFSLTPTSPRQCFNISIVDDAVLEPPEYFMGSLVPLDPLPPAITFRDLTTNVVISDNNDGTVGFDFVDVEVSESVGVAVLTVSFQTPSEVSPGAQVNLSLSTADNTANSSDYVGVTVEFTLNGGETYTVEISIINDTIEEFPNTENFTATLTLLGSNVAVTLDPDTAYVTIIDDDEPVEAVIGFELESYNVTEGDPSVQLCASILQPTDLSLLDPSFQVFVLFSVEDETAISPDDFENIATTLEFTFSATRRCVGVGIEDDNLLEDSEEFTARLSPDGPLPPGLRLMPDAALVSIFDNDVEPPTDGGGSGGDPHYSIKLPSGQLLCFSVHGEKNFPFNLISNNLLQMNAFFIEDAVRDEITWIGSLGVVVQQTHYKKSNATKIRFDAHDQMIYINNRVNLHARKVEKLTLENGKLTVSEALRRLGDRKPEVEVDLVDIGLHFTVRFVKKRHLDMMWRRVDLQSEDSHGIIGQFLRKGVEIDETRKLLYLPSLEPVPVMRSSVWHFMERESPDPEQKLCWQAMNPGYQGKGLIEGTYLDYLVDDVLSSDFKFNPESNE